MDHGEDTRVVLNGVTLSISIPNLYFQAIFTTFQCWKNLFESKFRELFT